MSTTENVVLLLHTSNGWVMTVSSRENHVIELLSVTERQVRNVCWTIGKSRWTWDQGLWGVTSLRLAIGRLNPIRRATLEEVLWCGGTGSRRLREIVALRAIVALQVPITLCRTVVELLLSATK
jgi:hypothetical protein